MLGGLLGCQPIPPALAGGESESPLPPFLVQLRARRARSGPFGPALRARRARTQARRAHESERSETVVPEAAD